MNTFIQFIDRQNELDFLESQLQMQSSFTVIYGKRRVGKSELIKRFISGKNAIYLLATQEVEKELLEAFSKEIARYFNDEALKNKSINSIQAIARISEREKARKADTCN